MQREGQRVRYVCRQVDRGRLPAETAHCCLHGGRVSWAPAFLGTGCGDGAALLATASGDTTARLWQLPGEQQQQISSSGGSEDGGDLSSGGGVEVEASAVLEGHPEEVYACEFLHGGREQLVR